MGLWYIAYALPMQTLLGMMTTLSKRWHSETCFYFLVDEAIVTLEDVWQILRLPIHGERVIYDMDTRMNTCYVILETE